MEKKAVIILAGLRSFIVTSGDGAPDNQYRIRGRHVEFRSLAPGGPPRPDRPWRTLDPAELQLHFALQTPVADWLDKTLYAPLRQAA
jgi:hypothetical protein